MHELREKDSNDMDNTDVSDKEPSSVILGPAKNL